MFDDESPQAGDLVYARGRTAGLGYTRGWGIVVDMGADEDRPWVDVLLSGGTTERFDAESIYCLQKSDPPVKPPAT